MNERTQRSRRVRVHPDASGSEVGLGCSFELVPVSTPMETHSLSRGLSCMCPRHDSPDPDPTIDHHFILMQSMTTWAAFHRIADKLELVCGRGEGFNIGALTCNLPPSLAPTLKQQVIPHKPYVDMLPWSTLRDRMLNSLPAINELEFLNDMYSLRTWGCTPWDPMGWEVPLDFAKKWWFLMDDSIIHTTNFWRAQRGEDALEVALS